MQTSDIEVSESGSESDSILEELNQLVVQTHQMCQHHQDALIMMGRIMDKIQNDSNLFSQLEQLHAGALLHIQQTGTSNFTASLISMLDARKLIPIF